VLVALIAFSSGLVQHVSVGGVPEGQASQESAVNRQARASHEVGLGLSKTGQA
jgi:hypothetical protein